MFASERIEKFILLVMQQANLSAFMIADNAISCACHHQRSASWDLKGGDIKLWSLNIIPFIRGSSQITPSASWHQVVWWSFSILLILRMPVKYIYIYIYTVHKLRPHQAFINLHFKWYCMFHRLWLIRQIWKIPTKYHENHGGWNLVL